MASTRKTTNFNLSQFNDSDKPSWRGDYNGDMSRIDAGLNSNRIATEKNTSDIVQVRKDVDAANAKAQSAQSAADTANQGVAKANQDISALGSKVDSNAASATNSISGLTRDISALKTGKEDKGIAYSKAESDSRFALKTDTPPAVVLDESRRIALYGDSWCTVSNNILARSLESDPRVKYVKNYGVNGAVIQNLTQQASSASSDGSDKDDITDVVIVMGTNNVYHDSGVDFSAAANAFNAVRSLYQRARIHYFPDNSKTPNAGRNGRYTTMIKAANSVGVSTYWEMLPALMTGSPENNTLGAYYQGNDTFGVQHLTDDGYRWLANTIINVVDGGSLTPPTGNLALPVSFDSNSALKFRAGATSTNLKIEYIGFDTIHLYGVIGEVDWTGSANPKTFTFSMNLPSGDTGVTAPVNISKQYDPLFLWGVTSAPDNIGMSTVARGSVINLFGNAPSKDSGWTFSQLAVDALYKAQYLV